MFRPNLCHSLFHRFWRQIGTTYNQILHACELRVFARARIHYDHGLEQWKRMPQILNSFKELLIFQE
jgi:hypothetical protein